MQIALIIPSLIVAFLCLTQTEAWIALEGFNTQKNYSSHCFGEGWNIGPMEKGERKHVNGECAMALCRDDRRVLISGCVPAAAKSPCSSTDGEAPKLFPQCCIAIHCKPDINNNKL